VLTRPGAPTREEFAARVGNEPTTMSFLAEPFEKFKRGETVFDCRAQCAFSYSRRTSDWKKLHDRKQWRDLAVSVLQVGYLGDLSYFMLAEAARGLGLREAASTYYKRALAAGKEYGCGGDCEGFNVPKLASAALGR